MKSGEKKNKYFQKRICNWIGLLMAAIQKFLLFTILTSFDYISCRN